MIRLLSAGIGAVFLLSGCSSSVTYTPVSNGSVVIGKGGSLSKLEDLDVWVHGTPNRPYRVVGTVEDNRDTSHPAPSPQMQADILHGLVAQARPTHPDALIIVSQFHTLTDQRQYINGPVIQGAPYYEYDANGRKSLVTPDPQPTYYPNGSVPLETPNLQTKAEAIVYVR